MPSIVLSDKARFYVAVCKQSEHSWLTFGASDPDTGKTYTLAYYGKRLAFRKDYQCKGRMQTLFGTVAGVLTRDYKFKTALNEDTTLAFEYKAFDISRDNYLEFAQHMRGLVQGKYTDHDEATKAYHKNELYYPNQDNPNQFDFIAIEEVPKLEPSVIDSNIERLGVWDNCRHTVLALLKKFVTKGEELSQGISTFAYQGLPFKATYFRDQILGNFYVLPLPPAQDETNLRLYKIRLRLYKRMLAVPTLKANDESSLQKFMAIKSLYESLSPKGSKQETLLDVLAKINQWECQNSSTIDTCRWFKTSKTKTRQMLEEIKQLAAKP